MSVHKSLKVKDRHSRARGVLSREERIERLKAEERWSEEASVFGLPKVRVESVAPRRRAREEAPKPAQATEEAAPAETAGETAEQQQ